MILPIVSYGSPVLRQKCEAISSNYENLDILLADMWETMYNASGVGLAAPQINKSIRLFIVDSSPFYDDDKKDSLKKVFINPEILTEDGEEWVFNEGCLSIPGVREDVVRKSNITIKYQNENFVTITEKFDGVNARVIQHEYDHINGILFTDKVSTLKKKMIKGKLNDVTKGITPTDYRIKHFK
ncbi:MAG: peptide deformylase [Flavobacteriales bacterium]|nr:peptide deformylase [Flavobacteriales bacterium]